MEIHSSILSLGVRPPDMETWSKKISKMWKLNKWDLSLDNLCVEEFNKVKFKKIFDFDCSPDTFQLIKDSALAPDFEYWRYQYDTYAYLYHYGQRIYLPPNDHSQKRVDYIVSKRTRNEDKNGQNVLQTSSDDDTIKDSDLLTLPLIDITASDISTPPQVNLPFPPTKPAPKPRKLNRFKRKRREIGPTRQ